MQSTAQISGHPIHPMLIPYPFALLSSALVFDLGARITGRESWSQTAQHLTTAGLGSAVVAAVPGIVDYVGTVPRQTSASRTATKHALSNLSALTCFALARSTRRYGGRLPNSGLALALMGMGLLTVGGLLGSSLVYHERIGVTDEDAPQLPAARDTMPAPSGLSSAAGR